MELLPGAEPSGSILVRNLYMPLLRPLQAGQDVVHCGFAPRRRAGTCSFLTAAVRRGQRRVFTVEKRTPESEGTDKAHLDE